jgi:hypothetical protein
MNGSVPGGLAHGAGVALRVSRLELGDDAGGNDIAGDGPDLFELARLERGGGPCGRGARRLDERRHGAGLALDDDRERAFGLLPEAALENVTRLLALGAGEDEAVREKVVEPGRCHTRRDDDDEPRRQDEPAEPNHRARELLHQHGLLAPRTLVTTKLVAAKLRKIGETVKATMRRRHAA